MARESKGQKVKTFTAEMPDNGAITSTKTVVPVYFDASSGLFRIFTGEHMFATVADDRRGRYTSVSVHNTEIRGKVMDEVIQVFGEVCTSYREKMKDAAKAKVIKFTFSRNREYQEDENGERLRHGKRQMSFCGSPAMHFTYDILYRVGDALYWQDGDDGTLHYRCSATEASDGHSEDVRVVEWTAEREAFFENMRASLILLINRVEDFSADIGNNLDAAIAHNAHLMLEPPRE